MRIASLRLVGIRCFQDTGNVPLSPTFNLLVGLNNSGKSSFLRGLLNLQGFSLGTEDFRVNASDSYIVAQISQPRWPRYTHSPQNDNRDTATLIINYQGNAATQVQGALDRGGGNNAQFKNTYPHNFMVPLLARRKASGFNETVSSAAQTPVTGTYQNLYARVDMVATAGHPKHKRFVEACESIIGLPITTKASPNGKQAGVYLTDDHFVTLDRMGDGITEMTALVVELCVAEDKLFVIEEPETDLHPRGLKALLSLVRESARTNQFVISTHSNIVVRELASEPEAKVFRVARTAPDLTSPSEIAEIPRTGSAHNALLRELGYEFFDFGLPDAWLFLEESSAEEVIRDVLIPLFAPELKTRLRTFSAGGVTNVEPRLDEFHRLVVFIHLQPAYEGRLWVRVDGDKAGTEVVATLRERFTYLDEKHCGTLQQPAFEHYFPEPYSTRVSGLAKLTGKAKTDAKAALLREVLHWTQTERDAAKEAWKASAAEVIAFLKQISASLA